MLVKCQKIMLFGELFESFHSIEFTNADFSVKCFYKKFRSEFDGFVPWKV